MSLYRELSYDNSDIDTVSGIQFCIMSPEDIRSRSVVPDVNNQTYSNNEPVHGGLFDRRMGVVEANVLCQTCEQRNTFCPGHFGHVELARPVFHYHFFDTVKSLIRCICYRCSRVPVKLDEAPEIRAIVSKRISRQKKWELMHKLIQKIRKCPYCGMRQPDKSTGVGILRIELEWRGVASRRAASAEESADGAEPTGDSAVSTGGEVAAKIVLGAEEVLRMFRRMTDEDIALLGFCKHQNRPEWMICTVLLVPPPSVRPTVKNEIGQRQEDDLTTKLINIIKYNQQVKTKLEKGQKEQAEQYYKLLQYEVATMIDNNIKGLPPSQVMRTGRPMRALTERLKSKEGRIRGNLMGKRVDFSARSVITPDPNISIDELGVPRRIAMNLTFPEIVSRFTRGRLSAAVKAGPDMYPGAKFVIKALEGPRKIRLKSLSIEELEAASESLVDGDVVERHLIDGDVVLFNRQPSLHKMSMMGHRVRVMDHNTFRLNVCVTPNFNADFDGDEMNMHVPQSMQTHEELAQLAWVMNQVISPRVCKPIISVVQDIALGIHRMTRKGMTVSVRQMMNLLVANDATVPLRFEDRLARIDGHRLLSTVVPKGIYTQTNGVSVVDGEIQPGSAQVNTKVYQEQSNGLVHAIHNVLGRDATRHFFDDTQKLVCDFLVLDGFSVGISDLVVSLKARSGFREVFKKMRKQVDDLVRSVHESRMVNTSNKNDRDFFESKINDLLNEARNDIGKIAKEVGEKDNRLIAMISAGSKGNDINMAQMVGCVGQVAVDGKRIPYSFDNRTLPHYTRYDDGPQARGFVRNSFISGLTPQEFFFHSMGGREGLIDTAVKSVTRETPIVIVEDSMPKYVLIGDWIDAHISGASSRIRKFGPEEKNMELLTFDESKKSVFIPTCDSHGNVTWGRLTAVTRHDPGERLYKVVTEGGREVTVAESKSLLVWDAVEEKFVERDSNLVVVGDLMPVTMNLPTPPVVVHEVDLVDYLPKSEYIYGTDFHRATRYLRDVLEDYVLEGVDESSVEESNVEESSVDGSFDESHDEYSTHRLSDEVQGDSFHIPRGWWEANNGTTFTLPYTKKSLLNRALSGRSNVDNIREGFIYPYNGTRCHGHLPDKFVLDEENGIFIGIFLADGHACDKSGVVGISNNDTDIQNWVKVWFEKHGYTTRLASSTHKVLQKTSYTMVGNSTLLARFLDLFVGHGSRNKYVPDAAFVAPDEFVVGLLAGYFSGDGSIGDGGIHSSSTSRRLTEGISMLCSRLGVFGRVSTSLKEKNNLGTVDIAPMHHFFVRAQWGQLLKNRIGQKLIHDAKKSKLAETTFASVSRVYDFAHDVVFDPIKSIEVVGVEEHPKLYDVTVPSTLNFGLANGLTLVDTSETGYIQRKLVKAMEDFKIAHDGTVRNAAGTIIQYLYGDEGMDPIKIERQKLPHLFFTRVALWDAFELTDAELAPFYPGASSLREGAKAKNSAHVARIEEDREFVVLDMFGGRVGEIEFPVHVARILTTEAGNSSRDSSSDSETWSDDPVGEILAGVSDLVDGLRINRNNGCPRIFAVILRAMLAPRPVLVGPSALGSSAAFGRVLERIRRDFADAIADASEMVGVVAAQSLSEPTTQLSTIKSSRVQVIRGKDHAPYDGTIGDLIDGILESHRNDVVDLGGDSCVLDLADDVYIVGVGSGDEKTSWRRISQVSRHPANGGMVNIKTRSGRKTCATLSHSFLKRTERSIEPVLGSDLVVGDRVPVARFVPTVDEYLVRTVRIGDSDVTLTRDFGWLCGVYIADGNVDGNTVKISKVIPEFQDKLREVFANVFGLKMRQYRKEPGGNSQILNGRDMSKYPGCENTVSNAPLSDFLFDSFNTGSHKKRLPAWIYNADVEFVKGVICGYFDGDGNTNSDGPKSMIRSASVSEKLTEDFILLLTRVGIFGSKCVEKHHKEGNRNDIHTIQIPRKYARTFRDVVGPMVVKVKADGLEEIIKYVERDDVVSSREEIDMIPGLGDVIAAVGAGLRMDGQSRLYKRFQKKEAIGRETLRKFVGEFERVLAERYDQARAQRIEFAGKFAAMRQTIDAARVDHRGVMDADSAMLAELCDARTRLLGHRALGGANLFTNVRNGRITASLFRSHVDSLDAAADAAFAVLDDVRDDKLPVLRRALDADVVWDEIVEIERLPDPGEMVYDFTVPGNDSFMVDCGVLVHNTLNTFHLSGVASASSQVRGVPRLKEIIDCTASKNIKTPVMKVYLDRSISQSTAKCIEMMNRLCVVRFKDVVSRSRIYFDPAETAGRPSHIAADSLFIELYTRFDAISRGGAARDLSPWVLRLEFDRQSMLDRGLTMADVDRALVGFYGDDRVSCIFSDDNAGEVAMRIRLSVAGPIDANSSDDLLTELSALENNLLEMVPIRGVDRIEKVRPIETLKYQRYDRATKCFEPFSEFMIETDGSNLAGVMGVPGVDAARVTSNDVYEVFRTLGVEAARQKLHDEILEVLNMTYINYRHVALLVDAITNKGTLVSVNRHGINQGDNGPLAKCSFEETVVRLVKAGIFSERDRMNGVSANIMLGQVAPCGTGDSKIVVDVAALPKRRVVAEVAGEPDADAKMGDDDLFDFDLKL